MPNMIQFPRGDAAEEEAIERSRIVRNAVPGCVAYHRGLHRCSRALGHRGDHVAARDGKVLARWEAGRHEEIVFG